MIGALLVMAAAVALVVPAPAALVERAYSTGIYPVVQRGLTALSNLVPFALFDLLLIAVAVWWSLRLVFDLLRGRRLLLRLLARTVVAAAAIYLAFLALWGLNYRRVPMAEKLTFDAARVTDERLRELAARAATELNRLHAPAHRSLEAGGNAVEPSLAHAFALAQTQIGMPGRILPARPKFSWLDPYFRAASVEGMTDPFFLEILVVSSLLPVERPFVVAHEWGHLAGFADEGEASFLGWLTCMSGSELARYSGWLFLYREALGALPAARRGDVAARLEPGPRADLAAIAERHRRYVQPALSTAGWRVYDRYLKANRIEAGTASYGTVVRLVLGLDVAADLTRPGR